VYLGKNKLAFFGFFRKKIPDVSVDDVQLGGFGAVLYRDFLNPCGPVFNALGILRNIF
jgi:hypothetical protein